MRAQVTSEFCILGPGDATDFYSAIHAAKIFGTLASATAKQGLIDIIRTRTPQHTYQKDELDE
jgi:hypothetical protein